MDKNKKSCRKTDLGLNRKTFVRMEQTDRCTEYYVYDRHKYIVSILLCRCVLNLRIKDYLSGQYTKKEMVR